MPRITSPTVVDTLCQRRVGVNRGSASFPNGFRIARVLNTKFATAHATVGARIVALLLLANTCVRVRRHFAISCTCGCAMILLIHTRADRKSIPAIYVNTPVQTDDVKSQFFFFLLFTHVLHLHRDRTPRQRGRPQST